MPQVNQSNDQLTLELVPSCLSCGLVGQKLQIACGSDSRAEMLRHGIAIACRDYSVAKGKM